MSLVMLSFSAGVCAGRLGVGGGFIVTPDISILRLAAAYAVGTCPADVPGNSMVATARHASLDHVDGRLGLVMAAGALPAIDLGKRIVLNLKQVGLEESAIRFLCIGLLLCLGAL